MDQRRGGLEPNIKWTDYNEQSTLLWNKLEKSDATKPAYLKLRLSQTAAESTFITCLSRSLVNLANSFQSGQTGDSC